MVEEQVDVCKADHLLDSQQLCVCFSPRGPKQVLSVFLTGDSVNTVDLTVARGQVCGGIS